jgi:hypothetical protein
MLISLDFKQAFWIDKFKYVQFASGLMLTSDAFLQLLQPILLADLLLQPMILSLLKQVEANQNWEQQHHQRSMSIRDVSLLLAITTIL